MVLKVRHRLETALTGSVGEIAVLRPFGLILCPNPLYGSKLAKVLNTSEDSKEIVCSGVRN